MKQEYVAVQGRAPDRDFAHPEASLLPPLIQNIAVRGRAKYLCSWLEPRSSLLRTPLPQTLAQSPMVAWPRRVPSGTFEAGEASVGRPTEQAADLWAPPCGKGQTEQERNQSGRHRDGAPDTAESLGGMSEGRQDKVALCLAPQPLQGTKLFF